MPLPMRTGGSQRDHSGCPAQGGGQEQGQRSKLTRFTSESGEELGESLAVGRLR